MAAGTYAKRRFKQSESRQDDRYNQRYRAKTECGKGNQAKAKKETDLR